MRRWIAGNEADMKARGEPKPEEFISELGGDDNGFGNEESDHGTSGDGGNDVQSYAKSKASQSTSAGYTANSARMRERLFRQ